MPATFLDALFIDALRVPVRDLGEQDPRFRGVFCPEQEWGAEKVGITAQFLGDAQTYHTRYSNSAHFNRLFRQAFLEAGIVPARGARILDIGAGSGVNTIEPCLDLFPDCRITATDLSPDLLGLLRTYVVAHGLEDRIDCVCTDAMNDLFRPGSFGVVVGAAILHHLIEPERALRTAHRALAPGGIALFFEPFEGLAIVRIAFDLILQRAEREGAPLEPPVRALLEAIRLDYATRAGTDKSAPHFRHMDDKWLFTRDGLNRMAHDAGFCPPVIVPHAAHATLFHDYVTELLRLGAGLAHDDLPPWAWDMIATFDQGFSEGMKRDVLLEGTIVLRKRDN